MDFNKAMVEMYKQRQATNNKSRRTGPGKRPKIDRESELSKSTTTKDSDQSEESIASSFYLPQTSFEDLYGCEGVKDDIILAVNSFVRAAKGLDEKCGWPLLVCGSRGIGKTSMVEAAANHAQLKLIPILLRNLVEQSRLEFKITLRQIEAHCRQHEPAVVLVDDLDEINEKEELRYMVRNLVKRLQDDEKLRVLVFCTSLNSTTTSGIDFLDTFQLKRPNLEARRKILELCRKQTAKLKNLTNEALTTLAIDTPSFTPVDLRRMLDLSRTKAPDGFPSVMHCQQSIAKVKQSFKRGTHLIGERPAVTWNDIGGLSEVRRPLELILRQVKKGNINPMFAGIALYGPPGCGKTMVAQAMANEAGLNYIAVKPAELVDKFLGETEKNIRQVFSEAAEFEPCMIYFDEFDGLCGTRGNNRDNITSAIHTLLSEMNGFTERGKSIILVSTNRLEDIDPAIMRPGRLSKHIYVGPPNKCERREILQVITKKPSIILADDVSIDELASRTEYFTGADLNFLVSEAECKALLQQPSEVDNSTCNDTPLLLTRNHFQYALESIQSTNKQLGKKPPATAVKNHLTG